MKKNPKRSARKGVRAAPPSPANFFKSADYFFLRDHSFIHSLIPLQLLLVQNSNSSIIHSLQRLWGRPSDVGITHTHTHTHTSKIPQPHQGVAFALSPSLYSVSLSLSFSVDEISAFVSIYLLLFTKMLL